MVKIYERDENFGKYHICQNGDYLIEFTSLGVRHLGVNSRYEFETIDDLVSFLSDIESAYYSNEEKWRVKRDCDFILRQDAEKDSGMLDCTSWYEITKKYQNMPSCYWY